jgi:hypothetical protein
MRPDMENYVKRLTQLDTVRQKRQALAGSEVKE